MTNDSSLPNRRAAGRQPSESPSNPAVESPSESPPNPSVESPSNQPSESPSNPAVASPSESSPRSSVAASSESPAASRPRRSGSIRGRLQWWYGLVYALSLIAFGCLVYWRSDREMRERAVQQAVSAVQYLDVSLRGFPQHLINDSNGWDPSQQRFSGLESGGDGNGRLQRPFLGPLPPDVVFRPPRRPGPDGPPFGRQDSQNRPEPGRRDERNESSPGPGPRPVNNPPDGARLVDGPRRDRPPFDGARPDGPRPDGFRPDGINRGDRPGPRPEFEREEQRRRMFERRPLDQTEFVVWRPDGTLLQASDGQSGIQLPETPPTAAEGGQPRVELESDRVTAVLRGPLATTLLAVRPLQNDLANLHRFGFQILGLGITTLVVGLVGGWWMSGRIVRPITLISATAATISATRLDARIETSRLEHELVPLGDVLNETFERLEKSFGQLTQFTADASHELRTPLAVIQSQIELALSKARTPAEYEQVLTTCLNSAGRMRSLVDGLLLLARADAERIEMRRVPLDLRVLVEESVAQLQERAIAAGVELECSSPEQPVLISGDPSFLARVPANLIDNAIQHTPADGTVRIDVRSEGREAVLTVTDTGTGIPAEHLTHVFERFYRVDTARSRANGGSGLGLAICQSLVAGHGGAIQCQSNPGDGTTFVVRLPLATTETRTSSAVAIHETQGDKQ